MAYQAEHMARERAQVAVEHFPRHTRLPRLLFGSVRVIFEHVELQSHDDIAYLLTIKLNRVLFKIT